MPLRSAASREVQPGLILLVCVAARCTDALDATIARMLSAIGWLNIDGSPLTRAEASQATAGTYAALRWLGALPDDPCPVALGAATLPIRAFLNGTAVPAPRTAAAEEIRSTGTGRVG
jgi:hypothetical protein